MDPEEPESRPAPHSIPFPQAAPSDTTHAAARWMQNLWGKSLSRALEAARIVYAPDAGERSLPEAEEELSARFWRLLTSDCPQPPESDAKTRDAFVRAAGLALRHLRDTPMQPFIEDKICVALRPVRRLMAGELTPEVCALLYDLHRGVWTPHLMKPQLWTIEDSLARTLAALPPDAMDAFWEQLQSPFPAMRQAMRLGLTFLRSAHAVPHLIRGLETSSDHDIRAAIVDSLEEISDPRALSVLHQLRRETAQSDWTLSRHIARAIRVIERQNQGHHHRTLLRATEPPSHPEETLLRPATDTPQKEGQRAADDFQQLLRSVEHRPEAAESAKHPSAAEE